MLTEYGAVVNKVDLMWFTGNLSTCTVLTGLYAGFWILTGCYPLYRYLLCCS